MSVPTPELPRPLPARTWRERLAGLAESFDVSPRRLLVGVVALACIGIVGWRLLAPPPPPAEMSLPFAQPSQAGDGGAARPPDARAGDGGASTTATAPTEVVVHVAGAVVSPGVRRLPPGSRVTDALDAAGGALPGADLPRINLAAPLVDGQQVYVPTPGEEVPVAAGSGFPGGAGAAGSAGGVVGTPVDLNSATAEQLDTLPGVGPATAAAIIAHREEHGPFTSVDQLLDVRGIGEAKLEQLRDLVSV
ncbi:MAG TPA: ComEA family DNA-binding protein [Acidimicrobiales bacterium]